MPKGMSDCISMMLTFRLGEVRMGKVCPALQYFILPL